MTTPKSVDAKAEALILVWSDDQQSVFTPTFLRKMCQCANCISETTGEVLLNRAKVADDLTLVSAEPAGSYGISLGFSDSHSTGIYTYDYLKKLSESL